MAGLKDYQKVVAKTVTTASNSGDNIMNNEGRDGLWVLAKILLGGKKAQSKWEDEQNDAWTGMNKLFREKAKEIEAGKWIPAFAKELDQSPRLDSSSMIIGLAFKMKKLGIKLPTRFIKALPIAAEVNATCGNEYNNPTARRKAVDNVLAMYGIKTKKINTKPKYF